MWFTHIERNLKGGGPNFSKLRIRSPKTHFYSFTNMAYFFIICKNTYSRVFQCKDELSLLTLYMDKNRPLPSGEIFDEFREKDFERRKANKFPKPLFPYNTQGIIYKPKPSTPEFTDEQQDERKRIGGW